MLKVATQRRNGYVADAVQLEFLLEHWNKRNPDETPITVDHDLTFDVELAKSARDNDGPEGALAA